ncbi:MAG: hypothetical protein J6A49_05460 [Clostridia bacterium]|nr:hypothetical protein [Clostridia bacterium]
MAKKKNNQTVVNNIESVNVDIDYDKLAEAIVKAQNRVDEEQSYQENKTKITIKDYIKAIVLILRNKSNTQGNLTVSIFAVLTSLTFKIIAITGFFLTIAGIYIAVNCILHGFDVGNITLWIIFGIVLIVLSVIVFLYSVIIWGASHEVEKEKDKNYIVSVFSGIVSFVALIIAIIALVKGVG